MKILKVAAGALLVVAFLAGVLLLNIFPFMPSSPEYPLTKLEFEP